jgi:iron-sulfur cluster repair protein YtfE (RIC family)
MRKLTFEDTFLMSEVLDKMNVDDDLNKLFDEAKKHPDAQAYLGGKLVLMVIKRWHKAKEEIVAFVSIITEKSVEEVKKMSLREIKEVLLELFRNEDFADFFNTAAEEPK